MCEERQSHPHDLIKIYNPDQSQKGFKKVNEEKEESKVEQVPQEAVKKIEY